MEPLAKVSHAIVPASTGSGPGKAPDSGIFENVGFGVALCLAGMTIFYCIQGFWKILLGFFISQKEKASDDHYRDAFSLFLGEGGEAS